jgi:Response regulator containing CheY-like receiver domain and AraC-type DNA-binding domain
MDSLCKVLIVEDEYITRQGIRNMVDWNSEGFEIVGEACNGEDALEMVEKLRPHMVLTDIVMPVMDGLELEKNLRTKYPEIQMMVLSSYSDFDYVRDSFQSGAVDYILKPTLNPADLLKAMKQVAARIPGLTLQGRRDLSLAACVEQLLSGFSGEEVQKQLHSVFQEPCFVLAGMDIARIFGQDTAAMDKQKKLLSRCVEEALPGHTHVQLVVNESVLLLVVNFAKPEEEHVLIALREAAEQIARQEPRTFYAASRVFSDPARLKEIYSGPFLVNLDRYFYYKGEYFLTAEEFREPKPAAKFNMAAYTKLLETLQLEKALDFLEDDVNVVLADCSLDEMELKTLVQNAWYQIISVLEDQGLNGDSLSYLKRDCLIKLYACSYSEDFAQAFSVLQTDFRAIIRKYEVNAHSSTIQSILNYIDSHYNEPLTLASLARQFNFNYSYLSTYFRSHHMEGFSEYLNKERIRHAAELLREGTLPVSGVCGAVGYTDQSYFTRVFKKLTGTTPREYRRNYGHRGE